MAVRAVVVIITPAGGKEDAALLLDAFQAIFLALPWGERIDARKRIDLLIDAALAQEEEVRGEAD